MKKITFLLTFAIAFLTTAVSSAQKLNTVDNSQNAGKVEWLNRQADFGKIPFGVPVTREFKVKNISRENLMILQVRTTCACTSVIWSQEPIPPGQTGVIIATFDAQKEGDFYKVLAVSTNFDPAQSVPLALTGKVDKKLEASGN